MTDLYVLNVKNSTLYENEFDYHYFEWIDPDNSDENLFSYMRKGDDVTYIVILNMSPMTYLKHPFGVNEEGNYMEVLNSDDVVYGGSGIVNLQTISTSKEVCNYKPYRIEVDVAPFAGIVLEYKHKKGNVDD